MKPRSAFRLVRSGSRNLAIALVSLLAVNAASATSATWTGSTDALWATLTNWSANPVPGTGDTATFNAAAGLGGAVIDLGAGVTLNSILFDTSSAAAYTIGAGVLNSQTLTLNNGGSIILNSTVANNGLFNAGIILGTDATTQGYTFANNSTTNALTIAGDITGGTGGTAGTETLTVNGTGNTAISGIIGNGGATAVALTKSGAGTLTVSGANLFTGGVTLTTGNLNINSTTALGAAAGTFTINGGTIDNTSGAANVVANSNPITLGGNFAFSTSSGTALNNLTLPGAVSMATDRTITLNGAGALTLGGLMTNTADSVRTLMVNNGTGTTSSTLLTIGSFNLTGAGSTARNDIITGSGNVTISGVVGNGTTAGSGLTKFGTGTLTLNGVNTYTGSTIVNNGTLAIGSAGQLNSGGTVTVTTNSSGLFQYGSSANQTLSGTVNGAGALTKTGSGILTLSGTGITYLGATTINGGTLRLTSTTATNSAISVNTNGTLALNGAGWGGNQLITLNGGTLLTDENAGFVVNNWVVKVTADSVLQTSGTGIATNLSQYFLDGGLNIASGKTLTFNPSTVNNGIVLRYNAASSGSLVISGTGTTSNAGRSNLQFSTAGAANFANTDLTLTNATMNIGAGLNDANTAGATIKSLSGNGKVFDDTTANTLTVGANDGTGSFSGVLAGTVALSLTKAGTGTQELSGINTYTGTTTINAGTLKISGSPTGNSATTLNGGTLQLDYTTNNTSKIHDSAILTLAGGTLDLKGGTTNVEVVASTTLTGGLSNVTQSQAGSVLRMGAITPGVGVVNFGADSIASTSNANNSAGILGGWATRGSTWAVNSGTVENGTNNYISAYTGTFTDVNRLGTGNTIASSANSNVRIIDGGTTGDITSAASGTTDIASLLQSATGGTAAYTPGTTDVLRLGAAGGILVPSGAGGLTIGNAVGNGQLTAGGNVLNGVGTLSITNNSANPVTINSALVNNGSGAVALATAGNVTLNGVNTYTGTTGIGGGTLTIAGTGSLNSGSYAGAIQIGGGGTLNFNSTASQTLSGGISGAGGLAKNNTSTLTLSGTNSYFGGTVINAGAISTLSTTALGNAYSPLTVNNTNTGAGTAVALNINTSNTRRDLTIGNLSGTLATPSSGTNTATIYINGNSILTINQATPKTFDGLVSSGTAGNGGGGLIYNGPSTLTLTRGFTVGGSANAATSNTVIQGGTLIVQGGSSTGGINGSWGTTQIQNGGTLVLDGMNASYWNGNGGQVLGNAGNGSGLTIRNGATWGDSMPIGGANSNNNTMTVTGIGSTATAAVTIGNSAGANGNSLIVQQGGAVWGGAATTGVAINLGSNATSLNNFLIVDGSSGGALAVGTLRVGNTGASSGNAMTIRNGGVFNSTAAAILGNAAGSNTNSATVTGVGSLWNLSNTNLTVGGTATSNGNGLYVLNGGLVSNVATLAIGTTTATGDLVNLGDGNATSTLSATAVTLAGATDTLNFNNGVLMARAGGGSLVSGSGTVNLVGAGTVNTNSFATTISSVIAGAGALNKTGAGTLTVSTNTNTYTGGTNVSNGTLLLSGAINMPASGTLAVGAGGTFSLNDATVRTSTTAATLGLVSGAALQFDWALGTASNATDTLTSTTSATTSGNVGIVLNPTGTLTVGSNGTLLSSAAGGLQTAGSTKYFLANNTNYTATLAQSDTAVTVGSYASASALTGSVYWYGGQVVSALGSMNLSGLNGSSAVTSNWSTAQGSYTSTALIPTAINAVFSTTSGATQQSAVSLDADMTLTTLTFSDSSAVTIGGSHYLTLTSIGTGGAGSNAIAVTSTSATTTTVNANLVTSAANNWNIASGKTLAIGGTIHNAGNLLTLSGAGSATLSGAIVGTGGLTQSTAGTVTLSGANIYTGNTIVSAGTLALSGAGTLGGTGIPNVGSLTLSGGTLDLGSTNQTVGAVSVTNAAGSGNTIGGSGNLTGTSYTASNTSGNAIVTANLQPTFGLGGLTMSGAGGTLTLTGANAYIGTTNVSAAAATLQIGNNTTTGSLSPRSAITLTNASATLAFNRSNAITQGSDFASVISGTGIVSQIGSGTLTLSGANTYSGGTKVSSGTLTAGSATAFGTGTLTIGGGTLDSSVASLALSSNNVQVWNADFVFAGTNSLNLGTGTVSLGSTAGNRMVTVTANTLTVGGIISNGTATGLTKAGDGTLILSGNNGYTGTTGINAGTLVISGSGKLGATTSALTLGGGKLDLGTTSQTQGAVSITSAAASGNTIQNGSLTGTSYAASNSTGNAIVTANLLVNGAAGLTKSGAGTLTLSGTNNTYNGGNIVNGGTLALSVGSTMGATLNTLTLGGGTLDLGTTSQTAGAVNLTAAAASGDTLKNGSLTGTSYAVSNSSGNAIISANLLVNGAAGLAMSGAGTLTLSGTNTYSGGTSISNGGTAVMSGSGTLGSTSGSLAVNSLALLDLNGTSQQVNALTGSGGTLVNNATGTVSTLTVASGSYAGAIADNTSGTGTLALTKTTSGTLTLSNTSTYTGATTISGNLVLTGYLGNTAISVQPGATFAANPASGGTIYAGISTSAGTSSLTLHGGTGSAAGFSMMDNAVGTFRLGSGGLTTITSTVLPMLSFDIGNSTGTIDLLDLGTMGGSATIAAGTLVDFSALSGATGLATGNYTFLTAAGGLGASAFTLKNSTITVNGHGYTFSLANSTSSHEILTVANAITTIGTTYTLAAAASAPKIHVGGASTVTATITNTGRSSSYADTLDYTNLTVSSAAQLNGTWPKTANASPIANDNGTDINSGSITSSTAAGSYTFTPSVASATNHTIGNGGGVPVLTGTTPVTVDVYALASPDAISGSIGNYHVGVAKALSLTNGTAGDHNEDLNAGITAVTNTTVSGSVSGLLGGVTDSNHLWVTLGGGGAQTGEVTVDLTSAGTVGGVSNTLGTTSLTPQTVAISGTGYNLAAAASSQTVHIGTMHVGGTSSVLVTLNNTAPADAAYTETLGSGAFSGSTSGITTSGSVSGIIGGGSGSGTLSVGFDTSVTAGAGKSGTTTVALNSTEVNSSGLGTTSVGSQTITVTGDVFNGSGKWTLASGSSGSWGTHANWIDANGASGAPGTFAGFDNVDSATFDGTGTTATIDLDSVAPSLKALTLSGATSYTIAQGTGTNKLTLKSSTGIATVTVGGSQAITAPITLASNSTFGTALVSDTLTISGNVDGAGTLTKTGSGTLALAGTSNTYSGGTYINGGTLSFGTSLPTTGIGYANLSFNNGGILEYAGTSSLSTYTLDPDTSNSNFNINVTQSTGNLTIQRWNGYLVKGGAGTLTVQDPNGWDGGAVRVDAGTMILAGSTGRTDWYANSSGVNDVVAGATLKIGKYTNGQFYDGQIFYQGGFHMTGGTFDVNGDTANREPSIDGSGTITNSAASTTGVVKMSGYHGNKAFSGTMLDGASGTGKLGLTLVDGNTWTFTGTGLGATYSGPTLVTGGNLTAGSTTAFSPNSAYTVSGNTLNLANYNNSIGSLTGTGNVTLGTATLTLGNDNTSPTFSGAISSTGSPVTSLVKTGSGIQTLSGTNTYTGATNVSQGTLKLTSATANNIANSASIHIASGAALDVSGLSGTHLALASGQVLMGSGSVTGGSVALGSGVIEPGDRALVTPAKGTLTIANALDLTGGTANIRLFGDTANDSDKLVQSTAGTITFGGTLNLTQASNFTGTFAAGNSWDLFDWTGTATGEFGTLNLPTLSGLKWDTTSLYTNGVVSIASIGTPAPQLVISTPVNTRVLANAGKTIDGTYGNSGTASLTATLTNNGGTLTVASFSPSGSQTVGAGIIDQPFAGSISDVGAAGTGKTFSVAFGSATASGTLDVVDQRSFSAGTPTIALGTIHAGTVSTGATAISSAGENAVTANASLGSFAGTNTGSLTLTTSDSTAFNGATIQTANYSLGGSIAAGNLSSASFSSTVSAELGSISPVVVNVTGSATNGLATWTAAGNGNWSASGNWADSNGISAAPGTFGLSFAGMDTATFDTGGHTVTVDTAVNVNALIFTGASNYSLASGSGSLTLAGTSAGINVASGTQAINAPLVLANDVAVAVSAGTLAMGGNLTAAGSQTLTKTGAGALTLSGTNSYGGATAVNTGTLYINGANTGLGTVTVEPLATLGGTGSIAGALHVTGTGILSPGVASLESLASGALTLDSGSHLVMEALNTTSNADLMVVTGNLTLTSPTLDLTGLSGTWAAGSRLTLLSYTGSLTGTFSGLADDTSYLFGSNYWMLNYNAPLAAKGSNFVADVPVSGAQLVTVTLDAYKTWASAAAFNADSNNDGVANGLAWILGATNPSANSNALLPTATASASSGLTLTFKRLEASIDQSTLVLEYSTNLTGNSWTDVIIGAVSGSSGGVDVTVTPGSPSDTVSVHIPAGKASGGKVFARLKATQP